jgi:hypothetical protein
MIATLPKRIRRASKILLRSESMPAREEEGQATDSTVLRVKELSRGSGLKINLGCGTDYHEGWLNIDGSSTLPRVDKVLEVPREPLHESVGTGVADYILANDIVEHVHHWQAFAMLQQIARTLKIGGGTEVRVPDCEYILATDRWTVEEKLTLLFGGQDVTQGRDDAMDASRAVHPEFFCHNYGWTMRRMKADLLKAGFSRCAFRGAASNFIAYAIH